MRVRPISAAVPCRELVPPFFTTLTTPPVVWPYSAGSVPVSTFTSSTEFSTGLISVPLLD